MGSRRRAAFLGRDLPFHPQHAHGDFGARGRERRLERLVSLDERVQVVVVRRGMRAERVEQRACLGGGADTEQGRARRTRIERADPGDVVAIFCAYENAALRAERGDLATGQSKRLLEPRVVGRRERARDDPGRGRQSRDVGPRDAHRDGGERDAHAAPFVERARRDVLGLHVEHPLAEARRATSRRGRGHQRATHAPPTMCRIGDHVNDVHAVTAGPRPQVPGDPVPVAQNDGVRSDRRGEVIRRRRGVGHPELGDQAREGGVVGGSRRRDREGSHAARVARCYRPVVGPPGIAIAVGATLALALVAAGCTGTGNGAADAASGADAGSDTSTEASDPTACIAAGGMCVVGPAFCESIGPQDCGSGGAYCCLQPQTCTDGEVQTVQASNYDQSCTLDSDCVAVGEGTACYPCALECTNAAINTAAHAQYLADVARTFAAAPGGCPGVCPDARRGCCRGGLCHADSLCPGRFAPEDAGADDAGVDVAPDGGPADARAD